MTNNKIDKHSKVNKGMKKFSIGVFICYILIRVFELGFESGIKKNTSLPLENSLEMKD
ncbi:hypothetical protein HNR74_003539 [Flammeovirga kamogawensis]|nr:hypothetical protein [Flammeovirga kamogawensis]